MLLLKLDKHSRANVEISLAKHKLELDKYISKHDFICKLINLGLDVMEKPKARKRAKA